ncbi:hypothetical protein JHK86_043014 [Glycine max]|nr:hypothetical protein JHK86_043014 [Glycine max]
MAFGASRTPQMGIDYEKAMAAMISGFCHDVFNELPDEFGSENLCVLEETFVDSEALRLEKAIILQLGKVGALELFNVYLSRSVGTSLVSNYVVKVDDYKDKVVFQSCKKKENKTRRKTKFVATAVLAELEKIRTAIEEDTKPVASLSTWADASEVHEKVLQ